MEEIINQLPKILQEIEHHHGVVHDGSSYDHVKQLHRQAREHVAELRKMAPQEPCYTSEQVFAFLDRIPTIMDELDHLSGDRALGRAKALFQLDGAIAQVKDEIREPGKDHRKYLTLEDLQS